MEAAVALELEPRIPPGQDELPYDFGPPMESRRHRTNMNLLIDALELEWRDRSDGYVGGNMAMYFNEMQVTRNDFIGPDVFVVLGAERRRRKSWVVWQEGLTPDVVVELLSARTESRDRGDKMRIYARALRVPNYYLFDPFDGRLEGYLLEHGSYRALALNASGRLPVPELELELGVHHQRDEMEDERVPALRWFRPSGELLPTPVELAEAEFVRAEEEHARAEEAHARAEEEHARAEEEHARAEAERTRADSAEARIRELEALLRTR